MIPSPAVETNDHLTSRDLLLMRDDLGKLLGGSLYFIPNKADNTQPTNRFREENVQATIRSFHEADIVYWKPALMELATQGAEAFIDTPLTRDLAVGKPQLWLQHDAPYYPKSLDVFGIHCALAAILVMPIFDMTESDLQELKQHIDDEERWVPTHDRFIGEPYRALTTAEICLPASQYYGMSDEELHAHGLQRGQLGPRLSLNRSLRVGESCTEYFAKIVAARRFMDLPIADTSELPLPRAERRRNEKAGRTPPRCISITLRRVRPQESKTNPEARTVDWSCQWTVAGHWRKQLYRSTGEKKPIWIDPYIKGPDDKPLKETRSRVIHVRR